MNLQFEKYWFRLNCILTCPSCLDSCPQFDLTKTLKFNSQTSDLSGLVSFLFLPGWHEWEEINLLISSAELIIVRADLQKCIGMSWMGDTGNEPWLNEVGCRSPSCALVRDNRIGTIFQWANHVARSGKGPHRVNLSQWILVHISICHRDNRGTGFAPVVMMWIKAGYYFL